MRTSEKKAFIKGNLMSMQLNTSRDFTWDVCYEEPSYGSLLSYLEVRMSSECSRDVAGVSFAFACPWWAWGWCSPLLLCFHTFTSGTWNSALGFGEEGRGFVQVCV